MTYDPNNSGAGNLGDPNQQTGGSAFSSLGDMYSAVQTTGAPQIGAIMNNGAQGMAPAGSYISDAFDMDPQLAAQMKTSQGYGANVGQVANGMGNTVQQWQNYANGTAPSAAQLQMQQGMQQGLANSQSQAASTRGNFGMANANRNAMAAQAGMAANTNQQAGILRAQEQQQGLAGLTGAQTAQGNQYASAAQLSNAQYNAALQQRAQYLQQAGMSQQQAIAQANIDLGSNAQNIGAQEFNSQQGTQFFNGMLSTVSSALGAGAM